MKILCPCLQRDENEEPLSPLIAGLHHRKFPNKILCTICEQQKILQKLGIKECPYHKQFKHMKQYEWVLAPINYIYLKTVLDKFKPDYVILDDCVDHISPEPFRKNLAEQFVYLATSAHISLPNTERIEDQLEELSKRNDLDQVFKKLYKAFSTNLKVLAEDYQKRDGTFKSVYNLNNFILPDFIKSYIEKAKLYGPKQRFAVPAIFKAVDYTLEQKKPVEIRLIDAEPPYKLFEVLAYRYKLEKGIQLEFRDDGFKSEPENVGSIAYKIGNAMKWFPEDSMKQQKVQKQIKEWNELIFDHFFNSDSSIEFGVVMRKAKRTKGMTDSEYMTKLYEKMRWYVPKEIKKVEIATYGNIKSQNRLEHCNVLLTLGTYNINPSAMDLLVNDWFPHLKSYSLEKVHDKPHGDQYPYKDPNVEILRQRFEKYEMYQSMHRVRPTISPKLIFAFTSWNITKTLEKDKIEVKILQNKIKFRTIHNRVKHLVDFVIAHNGRVSRVDAEEMLRKQYKLSERRAYDEITRLIQNTEHLQLKRGMIEYVA